MAKLAEDTVSTHLSRRLREERDRLVRRWLDRIRARVDLSEGDVFPTEELLDHVPLLVAGIADHLARPHADISADGGVAEKAMELGELRFSQGFSAHQILKEYEILGGILFNFLVEAGDELEGDCSPAAALACGQRMWRALSVVQQVTASRYLWAMEERVREREERLRGFNRMVSHELRNRIGVLQGAAHMLREDVGEERKEELLTVVAANVDAAAALIENLDTLSQVDADARQQRHVMLEGAVAEVARQLRDMAEAAGVEIRVAPGMAEVEVNAAAVEFCLTNYLANAIKYADTAKEHRWVEVRGRIEQEGGEESRALVVEVADNGRGVPPEARDRLFERFFRAHEEAAPEVEGTGIGLSLVKETIDRFGGSVWADFPEGPEGGSVFAFRLPCRRHEDGCAPVGGR